MQTKEELQNGERGRGLPAAPCSPLDSAPLPEIAALDEDLRQWYMADADARYVPGVPIKIQIVRLLRRLLEHGNHRQDGACYGEGSQDNVEPQKLVGESAGGALVSVNGLGKLFGDCGGEGSFDLLVQLRSGLGVVTQCLDDLINRHRGVSALSGVTHGVEGGANDLALAQTPTKSAGDTPRSQPAAGVETESEGGCCQQRLVLPLVSREFAICLASESQKEMWEGMTSEDVVVTIGNLFIRKWDSEHGEKYGRIGGELTYEEVRGCLGKASRQNK